MTEAPLDEQYLQWLYGQVAVVEEEDQSLTFWRLFRQLYTTEFVWLVPNDDNRLEDGKAIRLEFLEDAGIDYRDVDPDWIDIGCSVLELMLGLARRLAWEADGEPPYWFWKLMENVGLRGCDDASRYSHDAVEDVLYTIIFRQYNRHGLGGFFPLQGPCDDQRNIELWSQLSAYVLELTA